MRKTGLCIPLILSGLLSISAAADADAMDKLLKLEPQALITDSTLLPEVWTSTSPSPPSRVMPPPEVFPDNLPRIFPKCRPPPEVLAVTSPSRSLTDIPPPEVLSSALNFSGRLTRNSTWIFLEKLSQKRWLLPSFLSQITRTVLP